MRLPSRRAALVASATLAASSAASVFVYVTVAREDDPLAAANTISFMLAPFVMAAFGALLTSRRPDNLIGWLFISAAAGLALGVVSQAYAFAAYAVEPRWPFASAAVVVQGIVWPAHLPSIILLFLLFPNGRPVSRRWAIAGGVAVAAPFALMALSLFVPGPIGQYEDVRMPLALNGDAAKAFDTASGPVIGALFIGPLMLGCASLIVRFRRSRGIERAQMKWLTFGAGIIVATQVVSATSVLGLWGNLLSGAAFAFLPFSISIAVLRYRLYDIDILIRRTLIYAAVSGLLVAAYVGAVALLQSLLAPFTSGSGVAVAVSTLAVVALFQPVRTRVQSAVDRRFYRSKYDAERTLDAFATRLRDQIDLGALEGELLAVVDQTVQPTRASVWLRQPTR